MSLDNPLHLAFVLVLVLLVFGAKRLPEMGRSLGSGMRGFRDALTGDSNTHSQAETTTPAPVALQAAPVSPVTEATASVAAEPTTHA